MLSRVIRRALGVSAGLLVVSGAGAQEVASAAAGGAEASRKGDVLQEIIVTARKRDESVRDVPTSITAFTGDNLVSLGFRSIEDILRLTPGVTFEAGLTPGSTSIIVRGITNDSRGPGSRTFGRFYGNVPLTNAAISGVEADFDTFDMKTVEVLKGPQGTLFGGSALAGAIRYEPNRPEMGKWRASAGLGGGTMASSDDTSHVYELMVNVPLGDHFALRVAGSDRYAPGFIDDVRSGKHDTNDYRAKQGRVMASWEATETLRFDAQYLKFDGRLGAYNFVEGKVPSRARLTKFFDDHEYTNISLYGGTLSWDIGPASLVVEGSNLKKDADQQNDVSLFLGAPVSGVTAYQVFRPSTDQDTYELRLVSNHPSSGPTLLADWNYIAGFFYMKSDQGNKALTRINLPTAAVAQGGGGVFASKEKAFYADVTRNFGKWELNLGGRYFDQSTRAKPYAGFSNAAATPSGLPPIKFDLLNVVQATPNQTGFNPKAAIRWFATDHATLVASYARGYRFGGINSVPNAPPEVPTSFDSDEINNYELGVRTTWLDGRVTADLTAFYIDWQRLQILQRYGTLAYTYIDNVGAAKITGAEFALSVAATPNWLFSLGGSFQNARTSKFFNSAEWGPIQKDTRLGQSRRFTGFTQVRYARPFQIVDFDSTVSYSYQSGAANNLSNTIPLGAYGTLDLAASVQFKNMTLQPKLSVLATNLTNRQACLFGLVVNNVPAVSMNMPRQVMLKLGVAF